jgi:hypothetical protein
MDRQLSVLVDAVHDRDARSVRRDYDTLVVFLHKYQLNNFCARATNINRSYSQGPVSLKTTPNSWRRLRIVIPLQLFVASFPGWLQHEHTKSSCTCAKRTAF